MTLKIRSPTKKISHKKWKIFLAQQPIERSQNLGRLIIPRLA